MGKQSTKIPNRTRYLFYLNPWLDQAFSKCPKCDGKTKVRKLPLVIHIDPDQLLVLNLFCRFCPYCELVIARKDQVEGHMAETFYARRPDILGNDYLVIGTLDRADWLASQKGNLIEKVAFERTYIFKDQLDFEPTGGWTLDGKGP